MRSPFTKRDDWWFKKMPDNSKSYGIIRLSKTKAGAVGMAQYHNDREPGYHSNQDIDPTRTRLNEEWVAHQDYEKEIAVRLKQVKRKVRKDAVVLVEGLITASPQWFDVHTDDDARAFFADAKTFVENYFGRDNLLHFTIHADESTPHVHFGATPIKDGSLSWKNFFGNKNDLTKFQDSFYEQVSKKYGMNRGEVGSGARHYSVRDYKSQELRKLDREIDAAKDRLESLQDQEIDAEQEVEDLERTIGAVEAGSTELADAFGAAREASKIESENRELEARRRALELENRRLGERTEQLERQVEQELVGFEERAGQARSFRAQTARCEAETGRIEKVCGLISGAIGRGRSALIETLTSLIRSNSLRHPDRPAEWAAKKTQLFCERADKIHVEPKKPGKIYAKIAKVESMLEKLRLGIKMGFTPKDLGSYDRLIERREQLDRRTPERITEDRNYDAVCRIRGLCSNIFECRGPKKNRIRAELAEIAEDKTLWPNTRNTALERIAWIDAGAPAGAPAGGGGSNPASRGHATGQGGEARERSIGGDAR